MTDSHENCGQSHDHGHSHGHHHHGDLKGRRLAVAIGLNMVITISQIAGGLISGSLALLSDALHNFSDVIALVISWLADRLASREFSNDKTFGYKRAEILAAMINALTLIIIGVFLVREAIARLYTPEPIGSNWVIALALLSILLNVASVLLLKDDAADNLNIRSAYLHLFTDVITSVTVLAGGFAIKYFGLLWLDSLLSILIAIYLIYASMGILMETLRVVMQFAPAGINLKDIEGRLGKLTQVENIHHAHLWQLDDKSIHFEAHIDFCEDLRLSEAGAIINDIALILKEEFGITHTILQSETGTCMNSRLLCEGT